MKKYISNIKKYLYTHLKSEHSFHVRILGGVFLVVFIGSVFSFFAFFQPPRDFPVGTLISVPEGDTVATVAQRLEEERVIQSADLFLLFARMPHVGGKVRFGEYYFETPQNAWEVVSRMTAGVFGLDPVRVTLPEGVTVAEVAETLEDKMPSFPRDRFLEIAKKKEGYLFPDTYFFLPNTNPKQIVKVMEENFHEKTKDIRRNIQNTEKTLEEIVIMASIIEKETIEYADMKLVSGILWERINIGMPLQVDAPFVYSIGKNSFTLTYDDLETDSPYNTYTNRGLPPTPIANPGIRALDAAVNPKESSYLFFLSDMQNNMHYAEDFEEHKRNKRLYLN